MSDEIKQRTVYVLTRKEKTGNDDTDIYVGSTSQPLPQRLNNHKRDAIRPGNENNRLYVRMNEVRLDNWEILPLLSRTCDIKTIREVEKKWVKVLGADLNSYSPIREEETIKEYRESRKDAKKEYDAAYYKNNKKAHRYYCDVCEIACGSQGDLKRHLDTLKHSYAWLNSVD